MYVAIVSIASYKSAVYVHHTVHMAQGTYFLHTSSCKSNRPLLAISYTAACLPVGEGRNHQPRSVPQVLVGILELCITDVGKAVFVLLVPPAGSG